MSTSVMRTVNRLPAETTARLRSTIILTSLPQIVSELVQNSLDADARHVNVGVDPTEWTCWVQDDGHGISVENLRTIGMSNDAGRYGRFLPLRVSQLWDLPGSGGLRGTLSTKLASRILPQSQTFFRGFGIHLMTAIFSQVLRRCQMQMAVTQPVHLAFEGKVMMPEFMRASF